MVEQHLGRKPAEGRMGTGQHDQAVQGDPERRAVAGRIVAGGGAVGDAFGQGVGETGEGGTAVGRPAPGSASPAAARP